LKNCKKKTNSNREMSKNSIASPNSKDSTESPLGPTTEFLSFEELQDSLDLSNSQFFAFKKDMIQLLKQNYK
jgi:hypothetical protein